MEIIDLPLLTTFIDDYKLLFTGNDEGRWAVVMLFVGCLLNNPNDDFEIHDWLGHETGQMSDGLKEEDRPAGWFLGSKLLEISRYVFRDDSWVIYESWTLIGETGRNA